jgi:antitoxin PrlF
MKTVDITSVSSKGQVVIPRTFRKNLGIETGAKLLVLSDGVNLLLKPMEEPRLDTFKRLINESRRYARDAGLKRENISQVIRKVRNANRN